MDIITFIIDNKIPFLEVERDFIVSLCNEKGLPIEPIGDSGLFLKTSNGSYKIGCISYIPDMVKAARELNKHGKNTYVCTIVKNDKYSGIVTRSMTFKKFIDFHC